MTTILPLRAPRSRGDWLRSVLGAGAWAGVAALGGAVVAYLVAAGQWPMALALMIAPAAFVAIHRWPLVGVAAWLAVAPLVMLHGGGGVALRGYWLMYRLLPLALVGVVLVTRALGLRPGPLPRLGLPEALMGGYLVASLLSIAYASTSPYDAFLIFFDNVFAPMCLYLAVRLLEPDERDLERLVPAVVVLLLVQSAIGFLSWQAPNVVPDIWLSKVGERTTGTLRSVEAFSTTILFGMLFLLHVGFNSRRGARRVWFSLYALLGIFMIFIAFSRATWVAGGLTILGALFVYRRELTRLLVVVVVAVVALLGSGLLDGQLEYARLRLDSEQSEESALSRLPPLVAAVRMFEARPITGWGFENFDVYDLQFQGRVGEVYQPDKDHTVHNHYLNTAAEQGLVGLVLLYGPAIVILARTLARRQFIPTSGLISRRFVAMLWLVIFAHFTVNQFARMQVPFGLGMFWLTLGLIASVIERYSPARRAAETAPTAPVAA